MKGSGAGGELWAEVEAEVEEVQQEVKRARQEMVESWGERVTQQIPKLLVTPVLTRDQDHQGKQIRRSLFLVLNKVPMTKRIDK